MSFDPQQADVDRQVDASMRMFERAKVGAVAPIRPRSIERVLFCPDGSAQDGMVADAAKFLRSRFPDATLEWLDARERVSESGELTPLASPEPTAAKITAEGEYAYDRMLAAIDVSQPDLVVVPCPFGRDFDSVGADSTGTVIDVLLSRCRRPMLVVRGQNQPLVEATSEIRLVVGSENESEPAAAALALGLASSQSRLYLNLVVNQEQVENLRQVLKVLAPGQEVDREKLTGALATAHAKLDLALHKGALECGVDYQMDPHPDVAHVSDAAHRMLLVVPVEADDNFGQGFVQARIRQSPHPVLVVPRP